MIYIEWDAQNSDIYPNTVQYIGIILIFIHELVVRARQLDTVAKLVLAQGRMQILFANARG